jgi:hypothetical protein
VNACKDTTHYLEKDKNNTANLMMEMQYHLCGLLSSRINPGPHL